MGNSTRTLRSVADLAMLKPGLKPIFGSSGVTQQPALSTANRVIKDMLWPKMNFKFNRLIVPVFYTNSWQQDYASISVKNLGWGEHAFIRDINNTAFPKPIWPIEVVRDLERTSYQFGNPAKICWLPNDQLTYATWGGGNQGDPGPNVTYTNPLGANITPANPVTQIIDTNGNIQVIKTFGVTGGVQPVWPAANSPAGTTTNDGTVVWQVADPKAAGFRVDPLPPQTGRVWEINFIAQMKPPTFTALTQTLEPMPDDFASFFEQGFMAILQELSPDPAERAKAPGAQAAWMAAVRQEAGVADRERDNAGFVPEQSIMDGQTPVDLGPAYPFRR